ncbi:hypothetical protein B0H14DRAFT_165027 [Mycena olivaceomarginata]|nr:hypothetical protein B0H14DRAFT_165027 [Mycena olivaceomarginata]
MAAAVSVALETNFAALGSAPATDAKAECGPDALPENQNCPLNVCCSKFGFCGTTTDFCGDGCQSGCDDVPIPSCGTNQESALTRRIGYYEAWADSRGCMSYSPEKISAETLTYINFAFALISSSFKVVEMTKILTSGSVPPPSKAAIQP